MLRLSIEGASQIAGEVWRAQLDPSELRLLGPCSNTYGRLSVILVTTAVRPSDQKLEFEPRYARVLNIGRSSETIVVFDAESEAAGALSEPSSPPGAAVQAPGDEAFLRDLPNGMRSLGEELLTRVRQESPGGLDYRPASGKYVESPDNFWTVRIQQPRANNLRLTVRGDPEHFVIPVGIELKPDMKSYSSFVISQSDQIPGALSIIRQARRKDGKGRRFGG